MKANVISIISLLCLIFTGCAFSTEESRKDAAKQEVERILNDQNSFSRQQNEVSIGEGELTYENVILSIEEDEIPGIYKFTLTWPESAQDVLVEHLGLSKTVLNSNSYASKIGHGEETVVVLTSRNLSGKTITRLPIHVRAERDLFVDRDLYLTENMTFNVGRVYFYQGRKIITNGYDLTINAKRIIVEDESIYCSKTNSDKCGNGEYPSQVNIITSYLTESTTARNILEGSKISISSGYATGILRIAAIGFDGLDGASGDELNRQNGVDPYAVKANLKGADGQAGIAEAFSEACVRGNGNMDLPCERKTLYCKQQPTAGQNGKPGAKGTAGEAGQKGGNTGDVYVTISEPSDLVVKVWHKPGRGGRGGEGAPGFVGGPGGKAGDRAGSVCQAARDGEQGPQGPQGDKGPDGEPGEVGRVQVSGVQVSTIPL